MSEFYMTGTHTATNESALTDILANISLHRLYVVRGLTVTTLAREPVQPGQQPFAIEPGEKIFNL
jgi:hypothetical protein